MLRLAALGIPLLPLAAAYEWYDVNNQPTQPWQKGQVGVSLLSLPLFEGAARPDSPVLLCIFSFRPADGTDQSFSWVIAQRLRFE